MPLRLLEDRNLQIGSSIFSILTFFRARLSKHEP